MSPHPALPDRFSALILSTSTPTGGRPPRLLVWRTQLARIQPRYLHLDVSRTRRQGHFGSQARRSDEVGDGESAEGCFCMLELTLKFR